MRTSSPFASGVSPPASAQSKTCAALELVQQAPPFEPTNALMAALELT